MISAFFLPTLNQNPVLDPYLVVMEVKYNGFMLSYIKQMVSLEGKIGNFCQQILPVQKCRASLCILKIISEGI